MKSFVMSNNNYIQYRPFYQTKIFYELIAILCQFVKFKYRQFSIIMVGILCVYLLYEHFVSLAKLE